nr:type I phosphomannose isomerase catalytic subunit [[Acholeplasma] multilocale]
MREMGFDAPKDLKIGEAWTISAHPNGMSYIVDGEFKGSSLKEVFENNRHLFGDYQEEFPLLSKIITPNDYLSVQVHPTDEYAKTKHNSLGKPESWYVLEAPKDAYLIYGHNANSEEELRSMVDNGQWDELLKKEPVKAGDFLYVEPGKIHAITPGVSVFELQRSSDITYRFYDYDRLDDAGEPRRLDIEDSINCTKVPDSVEQIVRQANKEVFSSEYFSLYVLNTKDENTFSCYEDAYFLQFCVIEGHGMINGQPFKNGESAITLGKVQEINFSGDMKVIISWIKK